MSHPVTPPRKTILLTGGAGYIGSHIAVTLLEQDYRVIVLDNYSNSSVNCLAAIKGIVGEARAQRLYSAQVDLCDEKALSEVFTWNCRVLRCGGRPYASTALKNVADPGGHVQIDGVIHLAAKKAVGESVQDPLLYYHNNVVGLINLLKMVEQHNIGTFIFSSSATVYGDPGLGGAPIPETAMIRATNPYGQSKIMAEQILRDISERGGPNQQQRLRTVSLRYFNPVGAHPSGDLGEAPRGVPANLVPFVMQVVTGQRETVNVFGDDWLTRDGTGERDYIHVVDLAEAHVAALRFAFQMNETEDDTHDDTHNDTNNDDTQNGAIERYHVFNIGTGTTSTVLEVIAAVEKVAAMRIPTKRIGRRVGDVASVCADIKKAAFVLGWKATRTLADMCTDAYRWQTRHPKGHD